jgi:hypothetical protein
MASGMSDYNPSAAVKVAFALGWVPVVWFVYGAFERKGFQAAGVVCAALITGSALLIFIYLNYLGKGWFRGLLSLLLILDVVLTALVTRLSYKLSSVWSIPIALLYVIAFGLLIELVGRRFEGHPL